MAKTVADDIFLCSASESNSPPFTISCDEAATQTFKKGWIVENFGTGYVQDCASDTPLAILGVAEQDGHNDTAAGTSKCSVAFANGTNIFSGNVKATSLADHVLAQSDLLTTMAIQRDTTNNRMFLNASTKSGANCRVFTLRTAQNTDIGDTNGRVLFIFLPNFSQSMGTS
jgi:hypothetical protein